MMIDHASTVDGSTAVSSPLIYTVEAPYSSSDQAKQDTIQETCAPPRRRKSSNSSIRSSINQQIGEMHTVPNFGPRPPSTNTSHPRLETTIESFETASSTANAPPPPPNKDMPSANRYRWELVPSTDHYRSSSARDYANPK